MDIQPQSVKMASVEADLFESVGYDDGSRCMIVKFRNAPAMRFEKVPRFRYQGLINAVRKDAYYKTFIKDQFLSKAIQQSV
jgi:KTSC domain